MQKKIIIRSSLLALIMVAFVFAFRSSTVTDISGRQSSCKESIKDCNKKPGNGNPGNMIWEPVLLQFVTSTESSY